MESPDSSFQMENEYEVEKILDQKVINGDICFEIKWKGYGPEYNTWEPHHNLNCPELLDNFVHEYHLKNKKRTLEKSRNFQRNSNTSTITKNGTTSTQVNKKEGKKIITTGIKETRIQRSNLVENFNKSNNGNGVKKPLTLIEKFNQQSQFPQLTSNKGPRSVAPFQSPKAFEFERFLRRAIKNGPPISVINDIDDAGIPPNFTYIENYIYGEGVPCQADLIERLVGCQCRMGYCTAKSCSCFTEHTGGRLNYDRTTFQVVLKPGNIIYECNSKCNCLSNCINRVSQRKSNLDLVIKRIPKKGWGVVTKRKIPERMFVTYYYGEVIKSTEAEKRGSQYDTKGLTYLFDLDYNAEDHDECAYTVDATNFGNFSRFFNHSCDPNLVVYPLINDNADIRLHHIAFFTIKEIQIGEELTFNYFGNFHHEVEGGLNKIKEKYICKCDATSCIGYFHK
ncbi:10969_t:CDS:1 [Funneliformis mosseae]|uniref:Histone-lysine N-methyltransferase n=1 Tax=Funneliformis mosseae TaxID=27381 RepID=A0A9N9AUT3_FUNMO|nr:10969_t:CDS:1 [Funneliformis mosseae]